MALAPRTIPRFLPTLTEVVQARPTVARLPPDQAQAEREDKISIVESVREQVDAELGELLRDAVAAAMLEQVDAIAQRLRDEIEPILRQAVADMVAHEIAARRHT